MPKENALVTQESTEVVLRKATDIMNVTNKILKNSKKALATHPDVMMINGLMWQKETVEEKMSWDEAMEYAKNLRLGGYDDWRLPTIEELKEVVSSCGGIPIEWKMNSTSYNNITDNNISNELYESCYEAKGFIGKWHFDYWSSTCGDADSHWSIQFYNGKYQDCAYYCSFNFRCVREVKK